MRTDIRRNPLEAGPVPPTDPVAVPLRELLGLLRPQRPVLLVAAVLGLVSAGLALVQPLLAMRTINAMLLGQPVASLAIWLVFLFLAAAVISGVQSFLLQRGGEALVLRLRLGLTDRLLRLPMREYDQLRTGDLLSRVGTDTTLLRAVVANGIVNAVIGVASLAGAVALMLWLDWFLFVFAVASVALGGSILAFVMIGIRRWSEHAQGRIGLLLADLERALAAMRTVRAARAEDREAERIGGRAREAYDAGIRVARLDATIVPAVSLSANGSFLLVLGLGGARVASGHLDIGQFVAFLLYVSFLLVPLVAVFAGGSAVQKGMAALQRIHETMGLDLEQTAAVDRDGGADGNGPPAAIAGPETPALELRDVHFSYGPGREVLRGVSFDVARHTSVALVGTSGAGKTTIFALVERFYEASRGTILLDGRDIASMPVDELRSALGYVQQECPLLAGTLRDNLTYAYPGADEDELAEVLRVTNLDEVVDRLPDGLDTQVGEHGSMLSGGERQRVSIARALLPRPRLLLLDEPTAHLDAANEAGLAELVRNISRSCTVLMIAHRSSTVRAADRIVVLADGEVTATGTADRLPAGARGIPTGLLAEQPREAVPVD
ncbi:ABC transporter ATP-binding protein [Micromonospora sp. NBRC 107095]|uniref:ABC transporter ATP-binding protein n=1 Tax=Micromonospora TaxID=1873 RepID=UPI0024A08290|nr:ABC transporter ATP-binding protein [Micromonospora sp. NBRC 107095]GLZ59605.1 ABC transporter [Micromonospora sp. NBRC 107095]